MRLNDTFFKKTGQGQKTIVQYNAYANENYKDELMKT
jgi:hypothetical protein